MSNLLIVHGGGPTSVLNASLYGAVKEAMSHESIEHIYGAYEGTAGFLQEAFIDFKEVSEEQLALLPTTPGTAIGSSRTPLCEKDYSRMLEILKEYKINYVIFNGGNGTMDACGQLAKRCLHTDIRVMGIPKTIDNDLAETDHSPGYGSAARFMAVSTAEIAQDVRSVPIHVAIIEAMGRNAGWIAAASALARKKKGDPPDMILLPEVPFDEEVFLAEVERLFEEKGGVLIVASEGIRYADGSPVAKPIYKGQRATFYGDLAAYLTELIIKKKGIKSRSEKPGAMFRSCASMQSHVDRDEAILAGSVAVKALIAGESGKMVAFKRAEGPEYRINTVLIPVEKVMLYEKTMPETYIDPDRFDVTQDFIDYCRPLIGDDLPDYAYFERPVTIKNQVN